MMHNQKIENAKIILNYLREGESIESIETTFERINALVNSSNEVAVYLSDVYFVDLYEEINGIGRKFLANIAQTIHSGSYLGIALCISKTFIQIYRDYSDIVFLHHLLHFLIEYQMKDYIDVTVENKVFKIHLQTISIFFGVNDIAEDLKLSLLRASLDRVYDRSSFSNDCFLEYYSAVQTINQILLLLHEQDLSVKISKFFMEPFLLSDFRYSPEASIKLFNQDMEPLLYEKEMFDTYYIPLLPFVEANSNLRFDGNKIIITNSGYGCLPRSNIRLRIESDELEIGDLTQLVDPGQSSEIYIEDASILRDFLGRHKKNRNIFVVISFQKFSHSYDMSIPAKVAGHWIELLPRTAIDLVLPYDLPFNNLSDKEFERLCLWVVEEINGGQFVNVLWLNEDGGGERGRDIIATESRTGRSFVFQCKRVEKFQPKDIDEELETFAKYVKQSPEILPDVYVLFTSASLTDKTKARGDELASQIGMEIWYWPKSTIDRMVRKHKDILDRFWKIIQ